MAQISNLQDFNMQIQEQQLQPVQQKQSEMNIKYIPNIMREQRENVKAMMDVFDFMESKGVITVNRPQVIEYKEEEDEKPSLGEVITVGAVIYAIIKIGLLIA